MVDPESFVHWVDAISSRSESIVTIVIMCLSLYQLVREKRREQDRKDWEASDRPGVPSQRNPTTPGQSRGGDISPFSGVSIDGIIPA